MLVLQRHVDEEIIVTVGSKRISIVIVEVRTGHRVRLGFTADPDVTVHRREIQDLIDRKKQRSVSPSVGSTNIEVQPQNQKS